MSKNIKNLIDQILADKGLVDSEIKNQNGSFKFELNANNFFTDSNPNGICSKADFDEVLINTDRITNVHDLIESMASGLKISFTANPYTNSIGQKLQYVRIPGDGGHQQIPVPYFEGLERLLKGYVRGTFSFKLTFDELYSEVKSQ